MMRRSRLPRRTFLKLGAASAALFLAPPRPLALAVSLRTPFVARFIADADALSAQAHHFEALLLPAYAAAQLIRQRALRPMAGPPNRAHDPAGAFTLPFTTAVAALAYRGEPPARPSLDDLWRPGALWPDFPRLVIGAALMRRGYSPNAWHLGHLAQVEEDLLHARPVIVREPLAALDAGRGQVALSLVAPASRSGTVIPPEGRLAVEFDWVIPRTSSQPEAVEALIRKIASTRSGQLSAVSGRDNPASEAMRGPSVATLAPLPPRIQERYQQLWSRLQSAITNLKSLDFA